MGLKLPIRAWFTAVGHVWSASFSQASRLETAYRHPLCGAAVTSHGEALETQHSLPRRQYNNECTEEHSRSVNRCGFRKDLVQLGGRSISNAQHSGRRAINEVYLLISELIMPTMTQARMTVGNIMTSSREMKSRSQYARDRQQIFGRK